METDPWLKDHAIAGTPYVPGVMGLELFAQAGTCESVAIITDRDTGQSRGFGFVEMGSNGEAQKAIQQFDGQEFKGRALKVNEAKERENNRGGGGGRGRY